MMTSLSEQPNKFLELAKAGIEFVGTYNRGSGKAHYKAGGRYRIRYDDSRQGFWVKRDDTGDSCGYFGIENVLGWFFTAWWKIDGIFVDEWVEQHSGVDISHEELEGLL